MYIKYNFAKQIAKKLLDYLAISESQVKVLEEFYSEYNLGIYTLTIKNNPILQYLSEDNLSNILLELTVRGTIKFSLLAKSDDYTIIEIKIKSTESLMNLITGIYTDNAYLHGTIYLIGKSLIYLSQSEFPLTEFEDIYIEFHHISENDFQVHILRNTENFPSIGSTWQYNNRITFNISESIAREWDELKEL